MVSVAGKLDDRLKSQIEIVHAAGELDKDGVWQDTNEDGDFDVFIWVKNVGASSIGAIEASDVFFGKQGDFSRIPYIGDAGGSFPRWDYSLENDTDWRPTATLKITIHYSAPLSSDTYFTKVIIPNGISDEYVFSM